MVFTQFRLILNISFQIAFVLQQPTEYTLLDLLIILLFEKLICEELHRTHDKKFTTSWWYIKRSNRSVCRKTDGTTRKKSHTWLSNINSCSIRVHKFQSSIFVSMSQIIFSVSILLRKFPWFVFIFFLLVPICDSIKRKRWMLYISELE